MRMLPDISEILTQLPEPGQCYSHGFFPLLVVGAIDSGGGQRLWGIWLEYRFLLSLRVFYFIEQF